MGLSQTYLYLCFSENVFEHCGQDSDKVGFMLGPFAGALLLPLDVESRGGADKIGCTLLVGIGEEDWTTKDSIKTEGSVDQESWEAVKNCSNS